jgi:hypothetical protein
LDFARFRAKNAFLSWASIPRGWREHAEPNDLEELLEYLARTTRLERREAERVVDEVLSFLGEQPEHSFDAGTWSFSARACRTRRSSRGSSRS